MKKEEKQPIVQTLERLFDANSTYYLIDFKRMKVAQAVELRKILAVKGGQVEGQLMPAARFDEVTRLGSRQDLLGKVGYLMASPLHRLMRTLQAPLGNVGILLGELNRKKNT